MCWERKSEAFALAATCPVFLQSLPELPFLPSNDFFSFTPPKKSSTHQAFTSPSSYTCTFSIVALDKQEHCHSHLTLNNRTESTMQLFVATAALFAGLALAQDLSAINSLPACGVGTHIRSLTSTTNGKQKTCINNMLNKAESLGCPSNNITCLCTNMDFGNGVRDCSTGYCPSTGVTDISQIIKVGNGFCGR